MLLPAFWQASIHKVLMGLQVTRCRARQQAENGRETVKLFLNVLGQLLVLLIPAENTPLLTFCAIQIHCGFFCVESWPKIQQITSSLFLFSGYFVLHSASVTALSSSTVWNKPFSSISIIFKKTFFWLAATCKQKMWTGGWGFWNGHIKNFYSHKSF